MLEPIDQVQTQTSKARIPEKWILQGSDKATSLPIIANQ